MASSVREMSLYELSYYHCHIVSCVCLMFHSAAPALRWTSVIDLYIKLYLKPCVILCHLTSRMCHPALAFSTQTIVLMKNYIYDHAQSRQARPGYLFIQIFNLQNMMN